MPPPHPEGFCPGGGEAGSWAGSCAVYSRLPKVFGVRGLHLPSQCLEPGFAFVQYRQNYACSGLQQLF